MSFHCCPLLTNTQRIVPLMKLEETFHRLDILFLFFLDVTCNHSKVFLSILFVLSRRISVTNLI